MSDYEAMPESRAAATENPDESATERGDPSFAQLKSTGLDSRAVSLIIETTIGARPRIVHWGENLPGSTPEELSLLAFAQSPLGSATRLIHGSLSNEPGTGIATAPGLLVQREGTAWTVDLRVHSVAKEGQATLVITCTDQRCGITATYRFTLCPVTGVLSAQTVLENTGESDLAVEWCAAPVLPVDRRLEQVSGFSGRWAGEFQQETTDRFRGTYMRENRAGRTSHDMFPAILLSGPCTSETHGPASAVHLAWSGNARLRIDTAQDGRAFLQAGELLLPGEIALQPGESYASPLLVAATSESGLGPTSQALHAHVRRNILDPRTNDKPRPVHYNTWEAVYFDHDEARLKDLANRAAEVGAERFVLDDGWFGSRRSDAAGLGDWFVSKDIYPGGLRPLADHVRSLGMEFGLWFEPEMVNPDSDLFRAHPDWVLGGEGIEHVPFRNQLTLDLTKPEVTDYLYRCIADIVEEAQVDYIKWDMNRDTVHPASGERGAMHRQTHAVYALIDALRERFPDLEIESCASGGARADYGVLQHTDRVWTSDNNDALDRQAIQRSASHFLPLSIMGSHVGPRRCHITGRVLSMDMRVASAIVGHMGMELDLEDETAEDRATLAAGIALYKQHRGLLHSGRFHRIAMPEPFNAVSVSAVNGDETIVSCATLGSLPTSLPPRLPIPGLTPDRRYRVKLVWPQAPEFPGTRSIYEEADLAGEGLQVQGAALGRLGIQLPLMHPATCILLHCKAEH